MDDTPKNVYVGICDACGQTVLLEREEEPEDANEEATLNCECAKGFRGRQIIRANKAVGTVCQTKAEELGFAPLSDDQTEEIKGICVRLIDGGIQTASYRITADDVISLKMKDIRVKIKRVRKIEYEAW